MTFLWLAYLVALVVFFEEPKHLDPEVPIKSKSFSKVDGELEAPLLTGPGSAAPSEVRVSRIAF